MLVHWIVLALAITSGCYLLRYAMRRYSHRLPKTKKGSQAVRSVTAGFCVMERGIFRLLYAEGGAQAPVRYDSGDTGTVPARVEDVARQLEVAFHVFCSLAKFPSPLENPEYPGYKGITIYFFNRAFLGNFNGRSFNLPSRSADPSLPHERSGIFYVANDLPATNMTPAHELFHQIQNVMTAFRNPWFFEGTARWAESLLGVRPVPRFTFPDLVDPLLFPTIEDCHQCTFELQAGQRWWVPPFQKWSSLGELFNTPALWEQIMKESYNAAYLLWFPLIDCYPQDKRVITQHDPVCRMTYTDGTPILQTASLQGVSLMQAIFQDLKEAEQSVRCHMGYSGQWTGGMRRAPENNEFIFSSIKGTIARFGL